MCLRGLAVLSAQLRVRLKRLIGQKLSTKQGFEQVLLHKQAERSYTGSIGDLQTKPHLVAPPSVAFAFNIAHYAVAGGTPRSDESYLDVLHKTLD